MTRPRRGLLLLTAGMAVLGACSDDQRDGDTARFCDRVRELIEADPFAALPDEATPSDIRGAYKALRASADAIAEAAPGEARPVAETLADAVASLDDLMAGSLYRGDVDQLELRERRARYDDARDRLTGAAATECG